MWLPIKNNIYHVQRIVLIYRSFKSKSTIRINSKRTLTRRTLGWTLEWDTIPIWTLIKWITRWITKINSIDFSTWDVDWEWFPIKKYSLYGINQFMKFFLSEWGQLIRCE